ncbi:MAG: copper amine oxidase N-terminal domain-containing protein [Desulfitobacteriaceae bacterium]|nr:copper amine oxidase N-terminal domain-containing protein [Desulfitobacteriaceae bacterium]MDD4753591.1 copper amine oxidase N-terminal domain-containing protein [Desulfitobacteriaceae bacterium]
MLKKHGELVLILLLVLMVSIPAFGADQNQQRVSLDNVFMESALLPFDFNGYVFVNGDLVTYNDGVGFKNYNINGRVLASIRLVANILQDKDTYWDVAWDGKKPELVTLSSYATGDKVVITVGSKIMQVNGKNVSLDVPAKVIENRTVLPLRAIGEAVNREIGWLNDVVIISKVPIDLSSSKTKDVVEKAKNLLSTCPQDVDNKLMPIATYNGGFYTLKTYFDAQDKYVTELYFNKDDKPNKVDLPGNPRIDISNVDNGINEVTPKGKVGNSIYYPTTIGSETKLYRLDFDTNKSVEICSLSDDNVGWSLNNEGWFVGVSSFGQDIYVVLHFNDMTMGGEAIYRLVNNSLVKIGDIKWLSSMIQVGTKLYYTDLEFMRMTENNLYNIDLAKDAPITNIALGGYTYDIIRKISETSISHGVSVDMEGLPVKGNFIYAMLYEEKAEKDNRNVVKIDTTDNKQTILPIEISKFWLVTDGIVYQEYTSGKLMKSDFDGNNARVLVDKSIDKIKFYSSQVYYTVIGEAGLFHLNAVTEIGEKLSDIVVNDILINKSGSYFINGSYEAGIFKISGGKATKIVDGFIYNCVNTDAGILYNKRGATEVYLAK